MFKKSLLAFLSIFLSCFAFAQTDSTHLRISLVTCGVGDEIWETFGHTAVRVTDSVNGTDIVYNYGTFNGYEKDFELKFMRGKLLYYVSCYPFIDFMSEYQMAGRKVEEQLLVIDGKQKLAIDSFLKWNAEPENRDYKYDFLFDNCATRIRDIFPKTLNPGFQFGKTAVEGHKMSYRQIINRYLYKEHFERLGINILLGSKIDKLMTNEDIMFLPDFLRDGIEGATVNGKKIAAPTVVLLDGSPHKPAGTNWGFIILLGVGLLTIAGLAVPSLRRLGNLMRFLALFVTGLLGCLILVMWFGTDHQACRDNLSILWALPTNLFLAFSNKKNKGKYAIVAIALLVISLLLHVLRVQELPLFEIWPLLLALLYIYGSLFKQDKKVKNETAPEYDRQRVG